MWVGEEAAIQTHGLTHRATESACRTGQCVKGLAETELLLASGGDTDVGNQGRF